MQTRYGHHNGTNNPQLKSLNSLTFFDDIQTKRFFETEQSPFRIIKLNTYHYRAFAWITTSQLVLNVALNGKAVFWDRYEDKTEKDS